MSKKTIKKGRLSQTEKYAIQAMLHDEKTPDEISGELNRSTVIVNKYIDTELKNILETIKSVRANEEIKTSNEKIKQTLIDAITEKIIRENKLDEGLARGAATQSVSENPDEVDLYELTKKASRTLPAHHFIQNTSMGGRKGITIMTQTASEVADANRQKNLDSLNLNHAIDGSLYNAKTGEQIKSNKEINN